MSGQDLELFHSLLKSNEYIQPMYRIGETFQASIWSGTEVPEFIWESYDLLKTSCISMKELAPFMEKLSVVDKN